MLLLCSICFAETSIKAEVDKTKINTDEVLTYKLIITSDEKNILNPQFPKFDGFGVLSTAQTSQVSFTKGIQKIGFIYVFILVPTNIGKFKIEPSTIKIKNKTYPTETFEIEVTPGKTKPKPEEPVIPEETLPETELPQISL